MKIFWISPTPSHPQDAGNRAHIYAMGREVLAAGHDVTFLCYGQESISDESIINMRAFWPGFVFVPHRLRQRNQSKNNAWGIDDWFNADLEAAVRVLHLEHEFDVAICEYVFLSKSLDLLPGSVFKILNCHDRMSDRADLLVRQGIPPDFFYTTPDQEKIALDRADLILAIQEDERVFFQSLTQKTVIEVGYPIKDCAITKRPLGKRLRVGYLASGNSLNRKSFSDFLAAVHTDSELMEQIEIVVAGSICNSLEDAGLTCMGVVQNESDFYKEVDLIINPMVDGTGLKIKILSAIRHGMPFVSTETGSHGIPVVFDEHRCRSVDHMVAVLKIIAVQLDGELNRLRAESLRLLSLYQARQTRHMHGFLRAIATRNTRHVRLKRVLLVTDVPFWEEGVGSHSRLLSLCLTLKKKTMLTVFFFGSVWKAREERIAATGFGGIVFSYKNYENVSIDNEKSSCPKYPGLNKWRHETFYRSLKAFLKKKPRFDAIVFQYLWLAYTRDAVFYPTLTVIDTHDVMAYRDYRFSVDGLLPGVSISLSEELSLLNRFDVVMAIQSEETMALSALLNNNTITICCPHGVDFIELPKNTSRFESFNLGFVGGNSDANSTAIQWFLTDVWPVLNRLPIVFNVYGSICTRITNVSDKVQIHGLLSDLSIAYRHCDAMINPMVQGGGIKIKSVEALAHGKPLIASPEGAVGIENPNSSGVIVAKNRSQFIAAVLYLFYISRERESLASAARRAALEQFNLEKCFDPLLRLIEAV